MVPGLRLALTWTVLLLLAACGGSGAAQATPTQSAAAPTANASANPNPPAAPVATDHVTIKDFRFMPAAITAKAGTTVTWINQDADVHTVAFQAESGLVSKPMQQGESFTHTFASAGTFPYICSIHPSMHGMAVVTT
ncbi:MAG: cupredoxin domain-containing protein [Candidatus Dormibacteraeota bacterium]|uniref:Cupredoxin domain-containing protein n=2 Tax=Candidatus Dormiibacter inghamiae TaxID=3127013 RepID=A0A934NHZ9_9BACT|nr:cupredoxin domain-containing protein [Candidatus Dormibacteraeota bacterium]MBJ7606345.1 cupredoxin domain-containing protein [Candidatus Dormibacteraeota bacterium]